MGFLEAIKSVLKKWWLVLIFGILMLLAGIWYLCNTGAGIILAMTIFIADFLATGVVSTIQVISNKDEIPNCGLTLVLALLNLVLGIILLVRPAFSLTIITVLFACGFISQGISLIVTYFNLKKLGGYKGLGWTLAFGIIGTITGILLIFNPHISFLTLDFLTSFAIFALGIALIALSISLKKAKNEVDAVEKTVQDTIDQVTKTITGETGDTEKQ